MRNLASLLLSLLISVYASAQTVKVGSGICGQDENKFRGSGVIVSQNGRLFVVTSNHVVLNGNGTFCHHVKNKDIGNIRADLIASDWSAGLALLELRISNKILGRLKPLSLRTTSAINNETMITSGFPYDGNESIQSTHGYVLQAASTRHWLGNASPMIELMDAHAEFGMSGGPAYSADGSEITGILSHQALEMSLGHPTHVRDLSESSCSGNIFNHIFVIPSDFVLTWMNGILSGSIKPSLVEVASEQIMGKHTVVSGALSFSITSAISAGIGGRDEGGANGSGIGGRDEGGANGSGIGGSEEGGANGSGIGGNSEAYTPVGNDLVIEVNFSPLGYDSPSNYSNENWFKESKKALLLNRKVIIPFLLKKDSNSLAPVRLKIESLDQFFRELANSGTIPLAQVLNQGLNSESAKALSGASPSALHNPLQKAQSLILDLSKSTTKLEEKQLISRVKMTLDILGSVEWQNITASDLQSLSDGSGSYSQAWAELFDSVDHSKFDLSVKLMSSLNEIEEAIRHSK